jgi:plasmid stabilization system protein ParE
MKVVLKPTAEIAIVEIANYISETIKMPETAEKYTDRLLQFAHQISATPQAYGLCKYPIWEIKNLQCAIFDKTWIFAFKLIKNKVVIYYIKNGKLLNY